MLPSFSQTPERLIRLPEVKRRVGLGRSTIYRLMDLGSFPKARKLGLRAIAWSEAEIDGWIAGKLTIVATGKVDPRYQG